MGTNVILEKKTTEPIVTPFGPDWRNGPQKHALNVVHIGATWRIRLIHPCATAMQPYLYAVPFRLIYYLKM